MGRTVNITEEDRNEAAAANSFQPLPAGWYDGTIYDAEEPEGGYKSEKNKGKPYYKVQLRVSRGDFTNRRVFAQIPLFQKWAPTDKAPKGTPTLFIPFFEALAEHYGEPEGEFEIPDPGELLGKEITFRLRVAPDKYAQDNGEKDAKRNEVTSFRVYDEDNDPSPERGAQATSKAKPKSAGEGFDL